MSDPAQIKAQIQSIEKEAFAKYNSGQFNEAWTLFQQIIRLDAKHSLANFYLEKIKKQLKSQTTPSAAPAHQPELMPAKEAGGQVITAPSTTRKLRKEESGASPSTRVTTRKLPFDVADILTTETEAKKPGGLVRVLIVDDSSLMRKIIKNILEKSPLVKVVGEAANGTQALDVIPQLQPDVITLDINMPVMDGVTVLKHIIAGKPMPVIMLSAFAEEGAATTFDCLSYGAVDFICKPSRDSGSLSGQEEEIIQKITKASQLQVQSLTKVRFTKEENQPLDLTSKENAQKILVMGAGEGGYSGYLKILPHLPKQIPCAIMAVQYLDDRYFDAFCQYLNQYSHIVVKKAEDQELLKEGVCYFTNQKVYLKIQNSTDGCRCQVAKKPDFLKQQNVLNHLLFSAAEVYGADSIGVVLAGKGIDGIEGIRELKRMRGISVAQDPRNCLAPELPRVAISNGYIDHIVSDVDMPGVLWHILKNVMVKK